MLRIAVAVCLVVSLLCAGISGCTWMGRTTGQAVRGMQDGADDFKKGYDEGHGSEPAQTTDRKPADSKPQDAKKKQDI